MDDSKTKDNGMIVDRSFQKEKKLKYFSQTVECCCSTSDGIWGIPETTVIEPRDKVSIAP